jgi:hypothetical protein
MSLTQQALGDRNVNTASQLRSGRKRIVGFVNVIGETLSIFVILRTIYNLCVQNEERTSELSIPREANACYARSVLRNVVTNRQKYVNILPLVMLFTIKLR